MDKPLRVLFLTNMLYRNANAEIVNRLAQVLYERFQCDITVMGYTRGFECEMPPVQRKL